MVKTHGNQNLYKKDPDNEFIIHDAREKSKQFFHNFMRKRKIEESGFKSDSENSETAFRRSLHRGGGAQSRCAPGETARRSLCRFHG